MKTVEEIRERIKQIEKQQKIGIQAGYFTITDVRNLLIKNFEWVLEDNKDDTTINK